MLARSYLGSCVCYRIQCPIDSGGVNGWIKSYKTLKEETIVGNWVNKNKCYIPKYLLYLLIPRRYLLMTQLNMFYVKEWATILWFGIYPYALLFFQPEIHPRISSDLQCKWKCQNAGKVTPLSIRLPMHLCSHIDWQ